MEQFAPNLSNSFCRPAIKKVRTFITWVGEQAWHYRVLTQAAGSIKSLSGKWQRTAVLAVCLYVFKAIKNLMKNYNARGEWVEPTTGLTGLLVTDETGDSYKRMIDIPESSKEKMFEYVKNNYIEKNGMADGAGKTDSSFARALLVIQI